MNKVVLDANIYVKLFKQESDSNQAILLINTLVQKRIEIIAPSIVVNEVITTCEYAKQDITDVCDFFRALIGSSLSIIEISAELISDTLKITNEGHPKSGYPTFSDSLYHAVSLQENALFVTAD